MSNTRGTSSSRQIINLLKASVTPPYDIVASPLEVFMAGVFADITNGLADEIINPQWVKGVIQQNASSYSSLLVFTQCYYAAKRTFEAIANNWEHLSTRGRLLYCFALSIAIGLLAYAFVQSILNNPQDAFRYKAVPAAAGLLLAGIVPTPAPK